MEAPPMMAWGAGSPAGRMPQYEEKILTHCMTGNGNMSGNGNISGNGNRIKGNMPEMSWAMPVRYPNTRDMTVCEPLYVMYPWFGIHLCQDQSL